MSCFSSVAPYARVSVASTFKVLLAGSISLAALHAGTALAQQSQGTTLPPVSVEQPRPQQKKVAPSRRTTQASTARSRQRTAPAAGAAQAVTAGGNAAASTAPATLGAFAPGPASGYAATGAGSATKTNARRLDTPAAVSVVTREELDDRQAISATEALRNVSGVQMPQQLYYDNFLIRGFGNGSYTFRNGLKLYGVVGFEDLAFVDHIEVAKGPTAMLYGRVQPGGLVDYITRRPQADPAYSIQQQFGSWGQMRTTADATGALTADKTLLYRVIGTFDKADSFIDYNHHQNWAGYAAFAWRPNTDFEANLQIEHYDQKNASPGYTAQMIPAIGNRPASVSRNWTQSDPSMWNTYSGFVNRTLVSGDWTVKLGDSWKLTNRLHYNTDSELQSYMLPAAFNATTGNMNRRVSYNPFKREDISTNLDLTGDFVTGPFKHKVLAGIDYFSHWEDTFGYNESGATLNRVPILNIWNPVYGNIDTTALSGFIGAATNNVLYRAKYKDTGAYVQDQISFGKLELLLGGRYDWAQDAGSAVYGAVATACYPACTGALAYHPKAQKFSPRVGLLYKLTDTISLYSSYSQSFGSTTTTLTFSGTPFPPQTGDQYEAGIKSEWFGGKLTASATVFDLYLRNVATPDPAHVGFSLAAGETRSRGVELELAGKLTDNISVVGSYTYDDARVTKDNTTGANAILGHHWYMVPYNSGNVWLKYDSAPESQTGWTLGAGVMANGLRQANTINTVQLPGYTRVDAMAGYRFVYNGVKYSLQLNVQNLFDTTYFETSNGTYSQYGAPRTILGSLKAQF